MPRVNCAAIVLKVKIYGESDQIVDLFTEERGRVTVIARGALKSKRRYMGALETGTLLKVDYLPKSGLPTLGSCDILSSVWRTRQQLETLVPLYYILELLRRSTPLEERDLFIFQMAIYVLEQIEGGGGLSQEGLVSWELQLMSHLGYHLRIDRCPYTQEPPDGLSLRSGGAISSTSGHPLSPVPTSALRTLYQLQRGVLNVSFQEGEYIFVRRALGEVWGEICGAPLKSLSSFETLLSL